YVTMMSAPARPARHPAQGSQLARGTLEERCCGHPFHNRKPRDLRVVGAGSGLVRGSVRTLVCGLTRAAAVGVSCRAARGCAAVCITGNLNGSMPKERRSSTFGGRAKDVS